MSLAVEETRRVFDERRVSADALRSENARVQRDQFDAEKKVAVADTSIQNLQRSIRQLEEERIVRDSQLKQLEEERHLKEQEPDSREDRSASIAGAGRKDKGKYIADAGTVGEIKVGTGGREQEAGLEEK